MSWNTWSAIDKSTNSHSTLQQYYCGNKKTNNLYLIMVYSRLS